MPEPSTSESPRGSRASRARSFGAVADSYDRARPSYPDAAAAWLVGQHPAVVLELGAGTGKLTEVLLRARHDVIATEPSQEMARTLRERVGLAPVVSDAEHIPVLSRSVDVVACGQSFHWFDHGPALLEMARVLRPGGHAALAWNRYDTGIPWVRRFQALVAPDLGTAEEAAAPLMETPYFGFVEQKSFRFWQPHTARSLAELTRSLSYFSTLGSGGQEALLRKVDDLYAEYGRGHDGMQLPYITHCYKAVVRHQELPPERPVPVRPEPAQGREQEEGEPTEPVTPPQPARHEPPEDPGTQLIDFR